VSKFTLEPGRVIARDGIAIASISGVRCEGYPFYRIGSPADLDDFAWEIVKALNTVET
jgi:hypothetical protein